MRGFICGSLATLLCAAAAGAPAPDAYPGPANLPAAAERSHPVAEIAGQSVSFGDLMDSAQNPLSQQQAVYRLRRLQLDEDYRRAQQQTLEEELDKLVDRRVLQLEAQARKMTTLQLVSEVKTPAVTDQEVRELYEARKVEGVPEFPQVAAELREGLKRQKSEAALADFYGKLRKKYHADLVLEPLRAPVAAEGPGRGAEHPLVTIVEFADFQCPFCRRIEPSLQALLTRYPSQLRVVFRYYPITDIHPEALHAAQAAVCADRQGKFWPMHDAIFADTAPLSPTSLRALAQKVGVDSEKFERCVHGSEMNDAISADVRAGDELSVHATPTLFINGRFVEGGVPEDRIVAVIEDELQRTRARSSQTAIR